MAGQDYPKLSIEEFGAQLLSSGDLDPIYVGLLNCREKGMPDDNLHRWLLAYWCFYHAGVASYMSSLKGTEFWDRMMVAARNDDSRPAPGGDRWPRAKERRHFRGKQATLAVTELRERYSKPEDFCNYVFAGTEEHTDFADIDKRVQEHRGFGDWIAFKVGDMGERVLGKKIDFTQAAVFMFKDPRKAAMMLFEERTSLLPKEATDLPEAKIIELMVAHLLNHFKDAKTPLLDRPIGLQEVETILCKWKSHMNGHYPINNDLIEIQEAVEPWVQNKTAALFLENFPKP